ncbi:MAG: hypothetical protein KTR20_12765 [Cellvibrionaceae bacterium]|nr:hypothetical protein [Cellvibrionaceae bacterium]
MLFSIYINQRVAIDWGLNLNQAAVFSVIFAAATWAEKEGEYWNVSKKKIIQELPLLTNKVDTIYRYQKDLISKGLIERKVVESREFFRVTRKGLAWALDQNVVLEGSDTPCDDSKLARKNFRESEKNPIDDNFLSDDRKKIRHNSEKNPANIGKFSDVLNNQDNITKLNTPDCCSGAGELMSKKWWPPSDICEYCAQLGNFTDREFALVVMDYQMFWLSDDGLLRKKPRSWGNHFKNSFTKSLYRVRQQGIETQQLSVKTKSLSVSQQLQDRSWAS